MVSDALKTILDTLSTQGKMRFSAQATEEQIQSFENEYNVTLPSQYKEWLLAHDGGEFFLPAGVQLYGVAHKPLIDVNDEARPSENYIVIGALASGDPILMEKDSPRISIYNHEAGRIEDDEIYDDFFAFLKDLYELLGMGE